jgi:hypothetical protein
MQTSLKTYWKALSKPGREQRLPIHVPLTYRRVGEKAWHGGATENISHLGVLFQAEQALEVGTPVEINFKQPIDTGEAVGVVVSCRGEIVRTILSPATEKPPVLAAKVSESQFKPRPIVEIRKLVGDDRGPMPA